MPIVSFIVPVFNAESHLTFCLDSILNQTVKDIQIICINDGSSDSSRTILQLYADKDSRIEIIDFSENKGAGAARNAGIERAAGTFMRMVDSDDFIPLDSTEKLVNAAIEYQSDFVRGGFLHYQSSVSKGAKKGGRYPEQLLINGSIRVNKELWFFDQHCTFLFRSDLIKKQEKSRYDESMANGEDVSFIIQLVPSMERVTLIPESVHCYRQNPLSITKRKKEKQYYLNLFKLYDLEYKQLAPKGFREQVDYFIYYHFLNILPNIVFPSISANLQDQDALEVLIRLKRVIDEHEIRVLCFSFKYDWQSEHQLPLISKQVVLMLSAGYIQDAYLILKEIGLKEKKQRLLQERVSALLNSTSWRITAPLRYLGNIFR